MDSVTCECPQSINKTDNRWKWLATTATTAMTRLHYLTWRSMNFAISIAEETCVCNSQMTSSDKIESMGSYERSKQSSNSRYRQQLSLFWSLETCVRVYLCVCVWPSRVLHVTSNRDYTMVHAYENDFSTKSHDPNFNPVILWYFILNIRLDLGSLT